MNEQPVPRTSKPKLSELIEYMEACALIARNGADIHPGSKELRHHANMLAAVVARLSSSHETVVQRPQTSAEMDLESACNWLACFADSESPIIRTYVRRLMETLQPRPGTLAAKINSPSDGHALKAAECLHAWTVKGPPKNPRDDQPCDNGCGLLWKDRGAEKAAPIETSEQPKNWAIWQCVVHQRVFAAHAGCSYCREGRAPTHDCNGNALQAKLQRHSRDCDCHDCHYSKKHPQVKPHHALCGCFECAPNGSEQSC